MRILNRNTILAALVISAVGATILAKSVLSDAQTEPPACTEAILHGGYGAGTTGLINQSSNANDITIPTYIPFAEAVHVLFDGRGNLSGSSSADFGGSSFPVTFQGTYSVKTNCTGSLTVNAGTSGIIHRDLVIVDDGKEVEFVSTDPGLVIAGYMKKQHTGQQ